MWCHFFLTVNPPKIIWHPKDQSVATGKNTEFSIKATGDKLLFQWKKNDNDLSDSDKYRGTKTYTLWIAAVEDSDEAQYRCLVKNDVGELLSDPARLRIGKFLVATKFKSLSKISLFLVYGPIIDDATSSHYIKPRNGISVALILQLH